MGIWPAAATMGNLAENMGKSTKYQWPWSYNKCRADAVMTGFDPFGKQRLTRATLTQVWYAPLSGKRTPEIDIFEVMPGHEMPGGVKAF